MATRLYSDITGTPVVLPVIAEDVSFTPSLNNITATYVTRVGNYSRSGNRMRGTAEIDFNTVSAIGGLYSLTVPGGYNIDGQYLATTSEAIVGTCVLLDSSAGYIEYLGAVNLLTSTTLQFKMHGQTAYNNATVPVTVAAGDIFKLTFDIPILEWRGQAYVAYGAGSATTAKAGLVDTGTQSFAGDKTFTGQINLQNGTAAEPAIGFASDDDTSGTGIYRVGANSLGFSTNGVAIGLYDSGGSWAFGNTTLEQVHQAIASNTTGTTPVFRATNTNTGTAALENAPIEVVKANNDASGSQIFIRFYTNTSTGSGTIQANGATNCAFGGFSDRTLKENIEPISGSLAKIMALKPCEFDLIDGSGHNTGFIAQEMQEVFPEDVNLSSSTNKLMIVGWSKQMAFLVNAIQEQQIQIENLTSRLAALES